MDNKTIGLALRKIADDNFGRYNIPQQDINNIKKLSRAFIERGIAGAPPTIGWKEISHLYNNLTSVARKLLPSELKIAILQRESNMSNTNDPQQRVREASRPAAQTKSDNVAAFKALVREALEEVLDEMTTTGAVAGYETPHAFGKARKPKKKFPKASIKEDMTPEVEAAYKRWRKLANSGYGNRNRTPSDMEKVDSRIRKAKERYETLLAASKKKKPTTESFVSLKKPHKVSEGVTHTTTDQRNAAVKYIRSIKNANKKAYAAAIFKKFLGGVSFNDAVESAAADRGSLGTMGAQAVRMELQRLLGENFDSAKDMGMRWHGIKGPQTRRLSYLKRQAENHPDAAKRVKYNEAAIKLERHINRGKKK